MGARVIQASAHVCLGGGVLPNSSPQTLTSILCRLVAIYCLREEALHGTILSLRSFHTIHSSLSPSVSVLFHALCLKLRQTKVQSRDLIVVRARQEREQAPFFESSYSHKRGSTMTWSWKRVLPTLLTNRQFIA
jgi:hypothetical protein